MIYNEAIINPKEFRKVFEQKFTNFCKKSPLLLSYVASDEGVFIYVHNNAYDPDEKTLALRYVFDFTKSVKENIFNIRLRLVKEWYPLMEQRTYEDHHYNPTELNAMVERGEITLNDIGPGGLKVPMTVTWRIERVLVLKDELFVRNITTGELFHYRTRMPVSILLRKLLPMTPLKRWELFREKAVFIRQMEEDADLKQQLLSEPNKVNTQEGESNFEH